MSRPSGGMSRPSPSYGGRSPSMGGSGPRPSVGGGMPSAGARPGVSAPVRPSTGAIGGTRPGTGPRPGGVGSGSIGGARPGGAGSGVAGGGRPTAGDLNNFLNVPRPSTGAIGGGPAARPGGGGAAADFLRDTGPGRPATLPAGGAIAGARPGAPGAGIGARPGVGGGANLGQNRPERVANRQELQQNRQGRRDEVRNQVAENYPRLDFWSDHPNWAAWRINRPYRWATWAALGGWIGYGSGEQAVSYDYGSDVYYQDGNVYSGDQPIATADEYAQQADAIAAAAPADLKPENSEWLPLGVFAVTQDGQKSGSEPTLFMQLAVSKEGIIAGTLDNKATNESQTLEGMIDKTSQRAAWGVKDKPRPIMETGINNLTQDTAPALVHFADGQTQQWLLVRLEEPQQP